MYYSIDSLSQFGKSILEAHSSASVHSVYRKTINLSFGTSLLSLQAEDTVLSPISLITSLSETEMERLPVCPGDPVSISNQAIKIYVKTFGPIVFQMNTNHSRIQNLSFTPQLSEPQLSDLISMLKTALEMSETGGFDVLFSSAPKYGNMFVLSSAKRFLEETSEAWKNAEWMKAARSLCSVTGLGSGLTPSGDDFLCGVLAGILLMKIKSHPFVYALREELPLHLQDTNDISRTFLSCALSDQFSEPVIQLSGAKSADCIFQSFRRIGHSSGMDTLAGIYFFLRHASLFQK